MIWLIMLCSNTEVVVLKCAIPIQAEVIWIITIEICKGNSEQRVIGNDKTSRNAYLRQERKLLAFLRKTSSITCNWCVSHGLPSQNAISVHDQRPDIVQFWT